MSAFHRYHGKGVESTGGEAPRAREKGSYLASERLAIAVNTAIAARQPLLVTGEPGTGKTTLAQSIAAELGLGDVLPFYTRSDHQARDVLYSFDAMHRFYDAQVHDEKARSPAAYVRLEALGKAIASGRERVVLIDEIDKAPRDLPNDLLNVVDRMEFDIPETGQHFECTEEQRPIVVITSNRESQLPPPFLRRCVFHHIAFPDRARLENILEERLGKGDRLLSLKQKAVEKFVQLRERHGATLEKQPATGELIAWTRVLIRAGSEPEELDREPLPFLEALLKTERDLNAVGGPAAAAAG